MKSSTQQYRNCRETSPQVQTEAPDEVVRAEQRLLKLTTIDSKILAMNIHGLQSNMGPASYLTETENNKKKNKTTSTGKKNTKQKTNHQPPKKQYLPQFTHGNKMKIQTNKENSLD